MDEKENVIEPLLEKIQEYAKTSYEIVKLKALDKTADITASVVTRLILISVLTLFIIITSIAVSLWIGDMMGKVYYGFFIVAAFYLLVGVILLMANTPIKNSLKNMIISNTLK